MGGAIAESLVFKSSKEEIQSQHETLWDTTAVDIDGKACIKLGSLCNEKKAIVVVNVATN